MRSDPPSAGGRGAGWVFGQFACGALVVVAGFVGPAWSSSISGIMERAGLVLAASGGILFVAGVVALGPSLTPFPAPKDGATLRDGSAYRLVRHPIYGGLLFFFTGWSLLTSPAALLPTALLAIVLDLKASREETWLVKRYAGYEAYRRRVRWRFLPGIR